MSGEDGIAILEAYGTMECSRCLGLPVDTKPFTHKSQSVRYPSRNLGEFP